MLYYAAHYVMNTIFMLIKAKIIRFFISMHSIHIHAKIKNVTSVKSMQENIHYFSTYYYEYNFQYLYYEAPLK